jgi:hypothetical protein
MKGIKKHIEPRKYSSSIFLFFLILLCSVGLGGVLQNADQRATATALMLDIPLPSPSSTHLRREPLRDALTLDIDREGSIDAVPERYQLGQELYIQNCASCHIPIPPQVFPTETWKQLLSDPQHYGQKLRPIFNPQRTILWNYLVAFSRRLPKDGETPYRFGSSNYFKALHPRVPLPKPVTLGSCVSCHPKSPQFNFRKLSPEWQNAP